MMAELRTLILAAAWAWLSATGASAQAAAPFDPCEELLRAAPGEEASSRCVVEARLRVGHTEAAAAVLARYLQAHPGEPWLHHHRGLVTYGEESWAHLRRARDLFAARGEEIAAFEAQLALVRKLEYDFKLEEAALALEKARERMPSTPLAEDALRLVEGGLALEDGRLDEALRLLQEVAGRWTAHATAQMPPKASDELRSELYFKLGGTLYELGRYDEAEELYAQAAVVLRRLGYRRRQAAALYQVAAAASVHAEERDRERVLDHYREALDAAREVGRTSTMAKVHLELARWAEDRDEALSRLGQCLALGERIDAEDRALCLGARAYALRLSDRAAARADLDQALALAHSSQSLWTPIYMWVDRLSVSWAVGPREQAIEESLATLAEIEKMREKLADEASAEFFSIWGGAYLWLAGRLLESSGPPVARADLELAFDVGERYRARVLFEHLRQSGAWHQVEPQRQDELRDLPAGILRQVEETLAADEALLAYQFATEKDRYGRFAGGAWLFAVHGGSTRVYPLHSAAAVAERLAEMEAASQGLDAALAEELYAALLEPAMAEMSARIEKLTVIPGGALHHLAFDVLKPADGEPLVVTHEVSVAPSAKIWLGWRRQGAVPRVGSALVLADPTRPAGAGDADGTRQLDAAERLCRRLPHAREEGKAIRRRMGGSSVLRLGAEASESYVKHADLRRFGVIHLASHAFADGNDAARSLVCLAPGGPGEDGNLRLSEIVELELDRPLVVLASCESAAGPRLGGEGVMSLARGFFLAGAEAVVGSFQALDDAEAKDFFVRFHGHLARGLSAAAAVRAAKREIFEAEKEAAYESSAWNHVVVLGNGSLKPDLAEPDSLLGRSWPLWVGLAVIGFALVIYLISIGVRIWLRRR